MTTQPHEKHIRDIEVGDQIELFGEYRPVLSTVPNTLRNRISLVLADHPRPIHFSDDMRFAYVIDKPKTPEFAPGTIVVIRYVGGGKVPGTPHVRQANDSWKPTGTNGWVFYDDNIESYIRNADDLTEIIYDPKED